MKKLFFIPLLFLVLSICAQTKVVIVPEPVSMEMHSGNFHFNSATNIVAENGAEHEVRMLNFYLKKLYGFTLPARAKVNDDNKSIIIFKLLKNNERKDAYNLEVTSNKIIISSSSNEGLFYGMQTLLQLLPETKSESISAGFSIPELTIKDYPRFQYRGMHLDVGRHFFDVDFVKKYIDYLAYFKYNTFHWHLTEDQGWRIEIKRYPRLTSVGAFRNGTIMGHYPGTGNDSIHYGGFYTQEQIKDVVKYAKDRFITIIPEIEMPGHASAAIAAYPELSCFPDKSTEISNRTPWAGSREGKQVQQTWGVFNDIFVPSENTFKFLENVLDEVMALFPSKYIHIGGDEAPKTYWKESAFCQKLIKEKNLKDEHGLQSYFIQRIEKYLNSKGRSIIGWDEILEGGLAPNATVMSWRGEEGGIAAAQQHHNVIMTPGKYVYLDHAQMKNSDSLTIGGYVPLDTVYNYHPIPRELNDSDAHYILGAQANVWTEYMSNPQKVEYMIFPRMSALSEVLWSPKDSRDLNRFRSELPDLYNRYQLLDANYFKEQ
ncbi:MAG TPA: beta-N-acetylhexosaminidase [Hanamia sp.]|nr:beta-N-acetylhexosaminidase [Hanamia sp.]